jgi:hypothetical protein
MRIGYLLAHMDNQTPPAAPGIPLPSFGAAPEPDFADSVCLRGVNGRCDHLWQLTTSYAHGNTAGTFEKGKEPRAIHRSCVRVSEEMELKGLTVHTCNSHSDPAQREDPPKFDFSAPADESEPEPEPDDGIPQVNLKGTP